MSNSNIPSAAFVSAVPGALARWAGVTDVPFLKATASNIRAALSTAPKDSPFTEALWAELDAVLSALGSAKHAKRGPPPPELWSDEPFSPEEEAEIEEVWAETCAALARKSKRKAA